MQVSHLKMQRYVVGWCGLMIAFGATYASAMWRVSQTEKFAGQAVKSETCESKPNSDRAPVSWIETCRWMNVSPK